MGYTRRDRVIKYLSKKNTKICDSIDYGVSLSEALEKILVNETKINKLLKQEILREFYVSRKLRESYES